MSSDPPPSSKPPERPERLESEPESEPPESEEEPAEEEPAEPPRRPRRWPIAIVLVGLLAAGIPLWRKAPHDREVHLDLQGPVESLELVWFAGDEAIRQSVMSFQRSAPPRRVTTRVSVPDGQYRLELRVDRGETVQDSVRHIDFRDGVTEVVIPVR